MRNVFLFPKVGLMALIGLLGMASRVALADPPPPTVPTVDTATTPFVYQMDNRRDPFRAIFLEEEARKRQEEADRLKQVKQHVQANRPARVKEPLESFPLTDLNLVATIIAHQGQPMAMVQDKAGKAYTVHQGNYMGTHDGRVVRIQSGGLDLQEPDPTEDNPDATRTIPIRLPKKDDKSK